VGRPERPPILGGGRLSATGYQGWLTVEDADHALEVLKAFISDARRIHGDGEDLDLADCVELVRDLATISTEAVA
jgi:hypothetical protein